MNEGILKT